MATDRRPPAQRINSKTLFDLVKLSFGVVVGAGALVALVNGYRRQRVDEARHRVDEAGALREATRLHAERFTAAVGQLGDTSEAVRLGAVHALAGLADDAPTRELRQTCIDVLCAYLRLPYAAEADLPEGDANARHSYLALREVRHTVIRVIRDHLRLPPAIPHSWQGLRFDLTGVTFDGGSFADATFSGSTVDFTGATFSDGTVDFTNATFSDGTVDFTNATFSDGAVDFTNATFSDGAVDFTDATFPGGTVDFTDATFPGGTVDFTNATFSGNCSVDFTDARFSDGTVYFADATFTGGTVDFGRATFSGGTVFFSGAVFSGGTVTFGGAVFSADTVYFSDATFSDGTVDLSTASGYPPVDLVPAPGEPLPVGLILPSDWYSASS
ncbi:pentapeptide repeat-containing protein [Streptomyces sp. NPDC058676]|uniref:pentapeptide repeat-containing protein n=1 Tax=unclassified Streptomyces TaxID=2593676 RepID=UPI0036571C80